MSSELKRDLQLEIGHVLFIDIVGYSKRPINEQSELLHELNDLVRGTQRVRAADAAGKLIRLPAGEPCKNCGSGGNGTPCAGIRDSRSCSRVRSRRPFTASSWIRVSRRFVRRKRRE